MSCAISKRMANESEEQDWRRKGLAPIAAGLQVWAVFAAVNTRFVRRTTDFDTDSEAHDVPGILVRHRETAG